MALAIDSRQHQQHHFNGMGYDPMRYQPTPHFTNPWVSAPPTSQSHLYSTSLPTTVGTDSQRYTTHAPHVSAAYTGASLAAPAMATGILPVDPELYDRSGLQIAQDGMNVSRSYGTGYSSAPTAGSTYAPTTTPQYSATPYGYQTHRRTSNPSAQSTMSMGEPVDQKRLPFSFIDMNNRMHTASEAERQHFSDALDASRGMVAMSQSEITPRNIYGTASSRQSSVESYGFPSSHSAHSSISSASTYPSYYNSSASEASIGDYGSAGESIDIPNSRTLPRPNGLPPAPSSMMTQFSSKVSSSSQKKHKCKICDKRFTRPSSLQTHMYSHTGEKPFACDVDGCGRHFSVVSNLRRHRKVHKGEGHDHPSPSDDE